jgi:hypothetical protein
MLLSMPKRVATHPKDALEYAKEGCDPSKRCS